MADISDDIVLRGADVPPSRHGLDDEPARAVARQTCTDHATCCDQHFHGLGAFDAHRAGGICRDAGDVTYRTGKRTGENVLQVWTDDGYCDKMRGCWVDGKRVQYEHPVTVWQMATTDEQRSRLQGAWGVVGDATDAQMGFAL